jgi:hypothetical protein
MSNSPAQLVAHRKRFMALTGIADPASVGINADGRHKASGGYHCGYSDLVAIGRYHGPASAHVGSSTEDYSARYLRDRRALSDYASAMDWGDDWPRGGRAAWLRFNAMLLSELKAGHLPALRGINFSLDGTTKHRYDSANAAQGIVSSTDTVLIHTHGEFWRDTLGTAGLDATLARIEALVQAAIANKPAPAIAPAATGDDDMRALIKFSGSPAVFLTDGVTARWVGSPAELADIQTLSREGTLPLGNHGEVRIVGRRELVGRIIGPVPDGWADLAEDKEAPGTP